MGIIKVGIDKSDKPYNMLSKGDEDTVEFHFTLIKNAPYVYAIILLIGVFVSMFFWRDISVPFKIAIIIIAISIAILIFLAYYPVKTIVTRNSKTKFLIIDKRNYFSKREFYEIPTRELISIYAEKKILQGMNINLTQYIYLPFIKFKNQGKVQEISLFPSAVKYTLLKLTREQVQDIASFLKVRQEIKD